MKTLTISLSPQQIARLQSAVETGSYASNSEVVRDALRLWEQRQELRSFEIARPSSRPTMKAWPVGSGRSVDADTLLAELKTEASSRG